jgi:hypothetical protein
VDDLMGPGRAFAIDVRHPLSNAANTTRSRAVSLGDRGRHALSRCGDWRRDLRLAQRLTRSTCKPRLHGKAYSARQFIPILPTVWRLAKIRARRSNSCKRCPARQVAV